MKKRAAMLMLGVVLAVSITACGGSKEKTYTQSEVDAMMAGKSDSKTDSEEIEETKEEVEEVKEEETLSASVTNDIYTKNESITMFASEAEVEETVLLDENDVKITVTDISYGYSPEIVLQFENNTDKELEFYTGTIGYSWNSVNGYMTSGYMNETISPGKKVKGKISLNTDELMMMGIQDISELQIGFHIEDENNDEYINMDPVTVKTTNTYDYSKETFVDAMTNQFVADKVGYSLNYISEDVLYDANGIKVNAVALVEKSNENEALLLEIENTGADPLVAGTADIAINGVVVSSGTWDNTRINPGKKAISTVDLNSILETEFKDVLGISEIGEISLNIEVKDRNYDEIADPERITIAVPDRSAEISVDGEEVYNGNDLKITSLGKMDDPSEYSEEVHFLFLVENTGSEERGIDVDYDGNAINGFMVDLSAYSKTIGAGQKAFLDVYIFEHNKEDCGIETADDVTDLDLAISIRDKDWHEISEENITVAY